MNTAEEPNKVRRDVRRASVYLAIYTAVLIAFALASRIGL